MANVEPRVTVHMAASLDGFIARKDGRVDWMEASDLFEGGEAMAPGSVAEFLRTIDLRRGLADELRYSILPVLLGDGITFFDRLDQDVALHLLEAKAYRNGMVALRYEVKRPLAASDETDC